MKTKTNTRRVAVVKPDRARKPISYALGMALVGGLALFGGLHSWTSSAQNPTKTKATMYGVVRVYHGDNLETKRSFTRTFMEREDGKTVELKGKYRKKVIESANQPITVSGSFAQDSNTLAVQSVSSTAAATPPPTAFNVAIIMVNFRNDARRPVTVAKVQNDVFGSTTSTKRFFAENSYGKFPLTGKIFGYYTLDFDGANRCNVSAWTELAEARVRAAGVNLDAYNQKAFVFPDLHMCGWVGIADTHSRTWYAADSVINIPLLFAHELAHNVDLGHAQDYNCTNANGVPVALNAPARCSVQYEYGDPYNPMGLGYYHFDAPQKQRMGWLTSSRVKTITANGTTTLQPIETNLGSTAGFQALKFRLNEQTTLYLEARKPVGFDARVDNPALAMSGVKVTLADNMDVYDPFLPIAASNYTRVVDATPGSNPLGSPDFDFRDAVLTAGRQITDPSTGTVIKVGAKTASGGFPVTITLPRDSIRPSIPRNVQAGTIDAVSLSLSWNGATDNKGVTGYRVYRSVDTAAPALYATLPATARSYVDTNASDSATTRYAYQIAAIDAAGNESFRSPTVGTVDVTPPAAVTGVNVQFPADYSVTLRWRADPDASTFKIYRAAYPGPARLVATTSGVIDELGNMTHTLDGHTSGTYIYWIVPIDSYGNETAPRQNGDTQVGFQ